jgi:hypothetical protein
MSWSAMRPTGFLELRVWFAATPVAARSGTNLVLRQGAGAVARLFAGADGASPVDKVAVGFGQEAADAEATALTPPPGGGIDPANLVAAVAPADFSVVTDQPGFIQVTVATVFHPAVDLPAVSEAGLLAGDTLYNQVVFEPVDLSVGQDITLFWRIDFPFGH